MNRTQEMIFSDYFFKHFGKTYSQINCKEGYRLNKEFVRKGKTYYIDVCFNNAGEYIRGFTADENGAFIIDGRGFSFEMFMDFLKELKF